MQVGSGTLEASSRRTLYWSRLVTDGQWLLSRQSGAHLPLFFMRVGVSAHPSKRRQMCVLHHLWLACSDLKAVSSLLRVTIRLQYIPPG
eukprot:6190615-Pleurochrysis_carterae.AAC.1